MWGGRYATIVAMLTEADARQIAERWIAAWNERDLDAILDHYADAVTLTSPVVIRRLGITSGTIHGKEQLREYFAEGLRVAPNLRFNLRCVLLGVDGITVAYTRETGAEVADVMTLDESGRAIRVNVYYFHGNAS